MAFLDKQMVFEVEEIKVILAEHSVEQCME